MVTSQEFIARLNKVEEQIVGACQRAGRQRQDVTLIGVSKTHPVQLCEIARAAGLLHLGENYVQEWREKRERLQSLSPPVQWHFIGQLQSNKAKHLVGTNTLIHTVDRASLIKALAGRGDTHTPLPILLQVNHAREPQKGGCLAEELPLLIEEVLNSPSLSLRGLMSIPPAGQTPQDRRGAFRALRNTFEDMKQRYTLLGDDFCELSMGMSADFETAIEEGATMVRVGTALFGSRA